MSVLRSARIPRLTPLFFLLLVLAWAPSARAKVGLQASLLDSSVSYNPLTRRPTRGLSAFRPNAIVNIGIGPREREATFDSTYTQATFRLHVKSTNLVPPVLLSYDTYRQQRMAVDIRNQMIDDHQKSYKAVSQQAGGEGIAIDLPYRIKSRTFRRLFGGDNVGVRVQGNININGSLRRQKFDELQNITQKNTSTNFRIDMVQQFTITGKIGQKVEVKVDQDSERMFDFENSLKLTYTGDEDEIIKKVEAGNVALNLGTKLATFSGRNTGLFGLKTEAKIGALSMTGIASLERGQKNRQSPNQTTSRAQFTEKDFLYGVYFWLTDTTATGEGQIVPDFRENYRHYQFRGQHIAVPVEQQVQDIELYVSINGVLPDGSEVTGRAVALQHLQDLRLPSESEFMASGGGRDREVSNWKHLEKSVDYEIDKQLGVIRLKTALTEGQALATAFRLGDPAGAPGVTFGTLPATEDTCALVLLRPKSPTVADVTWNLMFRHVYYMNAANLDKNNFKLRILHNAATAQEEEGPPGSSQSYLQYFDFDQQGVGGAGQPDGLVDDLPAIIRWDLGELQFFDLTPFNPSGYYVGTDLHKWDLPPSGLPDSSAYRVPYLYTELRTQIASHGAGLWRFLTEFKGSSSVFDLGPLVLEGSEEVTLNGQPLKRGTDYTIDYGSGQLRILNEAARATGAALDVTYESGRVFQLDKTTLLGARAEYALWQDSYIGGMWLYLNQKTLDKRVRIGNEPIRNTLYDLNTSLKFRPNFMTQAVNALPLIRTDAPSEITLEGEVARVNPNPNSLENPRTGDYNGLAYLDDFEGSRRATPLGLSRRQWSISSIPLDHDLGAHPHRGRLRWYNPDPAHQVQVKDVFPDREINSQVANTLQSLVMEFTPDGTYGDTATSWGGVMRFLGEGYSDQSRAQFLEFWIKLPSENLQRQQPDARLIIDLGKVSEDALPNGKMNTEDRSRYGTPCSNERQECGDGILQPEEDVGLDGMAAPDPGDSAEWNGPDMPLVPSLDDWSYSVNSSDFSHINGTERNRTDETPYPDTEDLDGNDFLSTENSYFSYTISLNESSPYIVGGRRPVGDKRWRLFRIPIQTADPGVLRKVGAAELTQVQWARVYLTGFTVPTTIEIVQMDIVGNEWQAPPSLSDTTEWVRAAVINSHENPGYQSPPGVEGEVDPITNLRQREQSLVLKIVGLDVNPATPAPREYFIAKNLYQEYNLLEYKRMKMFIHGGDSLAAMHFRPDHYQLILRLGQNYSDITNNYYDIITDVKPGWDPENQIDILLGDLADMNRLRTQAVADTVNNPDLTSIGRFAWANNPAQPGDSMVISGSPSLSRIGFIALGVRTRGDKHWESHNEEIWVDELRLSEIYKDPGTAADFGATVRIADFIDVSGGFRATDADFHNVNTRINNSQASSNAWRGNVTLNLQKAYLEKFDVRLPVSFGYTANQSTPRVVPGSDRRIQPEQAPDSIKSLQTTYNYRVSYSKGATSRHPLVRWTLEKLTASYDYAWDERSDFNIRKAKSEQSGAQAAYAFPTNKGRGVAPLKWLHGTPILGRIIGNPRIYYKPTKLTVNAQGDQRSSSQQSRTGQTTGLDQFTTARSLNIGFAPTDPITTDFTRSHRGRLYKGDWLKLLQYDFGKTTDITQSLTNTYSPDFASWFRPTFNYSAAYTWGNTGQNEVSQSVSNQRSFGGDVTLDFTQIFGIGGGGRERSRGRNGRHGAGDERTPGLPGGPDDRGRVPGDSLGLPFDTSGTRPGDGESFRPDSLQAPGDSTGARPGTNRPRERRGSVFGSLSHTLWPVRFVMTKIDPIALSYDNTARHAQAGTLGQATPAYQFGLSQDPGVPTVTGIVNLPTRSTNEDITARSGLRLTRDLRTTFNYNIRKAENVSSVNSGSTEETQFWMGAKKGDPTAFPFVDVGVDWSGLERIAFLSHVSKTVSLSSAVSNKLRETWTNKRSNVVSRDYTRAFNPLLGVNVAWKGDIDSQVRYTTTNTYSASLTQGNKSLQSENRISGTVSYSIRTGFRVPLFILRSIKMQNQTTFSLTVDYGAQKREVSEASGGFRTTENTVSWSLAPRMRYSFSNTVTGEAYVQMQRNKDKVKDSKSQVFEFGIQVNIAIRG